MIEERHGHCFRLAHGTVAVHAGCQCRRAGGRLVAKFCLWARGRRWCLAFYRFVVAGGTAGLAVHQAVGAKPDVELRLAEDAELLAPAAGLDLLALGAHDPAGGLGGHE